MACWLLFHICAGGGNASDLLPFAAAEQVVVVPGAVLSVAHLQAAEQQLRQKEQQLQLQQQQEHVEEGPSVADVPASDELTANSAGGPLEHCSYFRLSFASVESDEILLEGFVRLKQAILKFQSHVSSAHGSAAR